MKLIISMLICFSIAGGLLAQEKYPVPKPTIDQKFNRTLYQYWALTAGAINLAKSNGITPYVYGKSMGKLFVPGWGKPDFDGVIKSTLMNMEYMRRSKDTPPVAKENQDGSVSIIFDDDTWHDYFAKPMFNVTYDEFLDYFRGLSEVLASELVQANVTMERKDSILVSTYRRK